MLLPVTSRLRPLWSRVQKFVTYFPLQNYLLAFVLFSLLGEAWLQRQFISEPSAFNDMLTALMKLVRLVLVPLLLVGSLSVLIPYLLLWLAYKKRKLKVTIQSPAVQPEGLKQELRFSIGPLWQPLWGQVYYRLVYDKGEKRSPKFSLVRQENLIGYAGNKQQGWYRWPLPGIREYEVDSMIIYMEDLFHFFKLAMPVKIRQSFFTRPSKLASDILNIDPSKTEQEDIRITDWRKVHGEMLNYKSFDSNDDVRRIVWKIYARNKELVVRTHEILDPFASHVSFYVSFFDSIGSELSHALGHSCLDFYKASCWTLYRQLEKQGLRSHFYTDQPIPTRGPDEQERKVEYALAVSRWQQKTRIEEWVKMKDATLVCLSSLAHPADVHYLVDNAGPSLTIVFVPLSRAIPFPKGWGLLKWIWVETEKDPKRKDSLMWFLSPVRRRMLDNENKILQIIERSGIRYLQPGINEN